MPMPPARFVPAVGDDPVVGDPDPVVLVVGVGGRQVRRPDPDRPVAAAVVLDHVVRDLEVAGVGVGEDRSALGDDGRGQARGRAAGLVDVGREAGLVATADVEAVDGRRSACAVRLREGTVAGARQVERDHRAVVDGLVAVPRERVDPGDPVGGNGTVAAVCAAVEDRALHLRVVRTDATRADALELDLLGDDQVLVVGAARVEARVGAGVVRVDDHEGAVGAGGSIVQRVLDGVVGRGRERISGPIAWIRDARANLEDGRVVALARGAVGPDDVEGEPVHRAPPVGGGDEELLRSPGKPGWDGGADLPVGPEVDGQRHAAERDAPAALGRSEALAEDRERHRCAGRVAVRLRHGEQLGRDRQGRAGRVVHVACDGRDHLRPGQLDGDADLGRGEVRRDQQAREGLELGGDGPDTAGCRWGSACPERPGRCPRSDTGWGRRPTASGS